MSSAPRSARVTRISRCATGVLSLLQMHITGVDPNKDMVPYALKAVEDAGLQPGSVTLTQGVAEELPLADASQDVVIATLVRSSSQHHCRFTSHPQLAHAAVADSIANVALAVRICAPTRYAYPHTCHTVV